MEEKHDTSIGRYLKRLREEQQLSIKMVSEKTCIHEKFLTQIEKDNYDDMGGTGYAKAMIMSYAKALKADEKLILQNFNTKFKKKTTLYQPRQPKSRKIMIPTSLIYIILLVILVGVITVVITQLYKDGNLNFSLRKQITESGSRPDLLDQPVKRSVSLYDSLDDSKRNEDKSIEERQKVKLNLDALSDTTDYTDKFLFEGKESPYNETE